MENRETEANPETEKAIGRVTEENRTTEPEAHTATVPEADRAKEAGVPSPLLPDSQKRKFCLPPLGWHAVRIAIGVFLCLFVFEFLPDMNAFYAAIATVICLKPDLKSSHRMGVRRIIGTVIGGGIGMGAMYLFEAIGARFEPWLIPLFILLIIYLCKVIRLDESASIGCIVLLSVLIMHKPEGMLAYQYVLSRIFETVAGVLIAVLINLVFEGILLLRKRKKSAANGDGR